MTVSKLIPAEVISVLDLGCGPGLFCGYLARDVQYLGVDRNIESIRLAKKTYPGEMFVVGDAEHIPLGSIEYDVVVMIGLLPYVKSEDALLEQVYRFLKRGGYCVMTIAADHTLYRWLDMSHFVSPHRFLKRKLIERELVNRGFRIELTLERGLFLTPLLNIGYFAAGVIDRTLFRTKGTLGPIGRRLRQALSFITMLEFSLPLNYGYQIMICCSKE